MVSVLRGLGCGQCVEGFKVWSVWVGGLGCGQCVEGFGLWSVC